MNKGSSEVLLTKRVPTTLKSRRGQLMLWAASVLTITAVSVAPQNSARAGGGSSMVIESVIDIPGVTCTTTGQECLPVFSTNVQTSSVLDVQYIAPVTHCSTISVRIRVDGGVAQQSAFIQPGGSTPFFNFGPVSQGLHTITVQGIGEVGGCNIGFIGSWAGTLHVRTSAGVVFNVCVQDDLTGKILRFNSSTGDYEFLDCRKGKLLLAGKGTVTVNGCKMKLVDPGLEPKTPDRFVDALVNTCTSAASATVMDPTGKFHALSDSNVANNSCICQ